MLFEFSNNSAFYLCLISKALKTLNLSFFLKSIEVIKNITGKIEKISVLYNLLSFFKQLALTLKSIITLITKHLIYGYGIFVADFVDIFVAVAIVS